MAGVLLLFLFFVAISAVVSSEPCQSDECKNATLKSGSQWDSLELKNLNEKGTAKNGPEQVYGLNMTKAPVYTDRTAVWDVNKLLDNGTLNLSGLNMTGGDVKTALSSLSSENKQQVIRLVLSNNIIWSLPKLIWPVELEYCLQELHLDHNPLGRNWHYSIPSRFEISRLLYLKVLNLSWTGMIRLDSMYYSEFSALSLIHLDLSHNQLSFLPTVMHMPSLRTLDLSHNHISGLFESLQSLNNLRDLNLANNKLNYLSRDSLRMSPTLNQVNLTNNLLRKASQIQHVTILALSISKNPWECSCPLLELIHQNSWSHIIDNESITCVDEEHPSPRLVSTLSVDDVHIDCPGLKEWMEDRAEQMEQIILHVERSPVILALCVAVIILIVAVLIHRHKKRKAAITQKNTFYTILDGKQYVDKV